MTRIESDSSDRQPLLNGENTRRTSSKFRPAGSSWQPWPSFQTISPKYRFIPFLGCLIIFLNEAEYAFKQVAVLRAIEAMYCIEYYNVHDPSTAALGKHIPERLCKDNTIQKQLAKTAGYIMFFRMAAAMIGCLPLGQLADKYGRKPVLVMHKVNVVVSNAVWIFVYLLYPILPIWTLYFSGAAGLIGGNFDLGLAMLFASYTDVMPSASERATLFFLTTSMQYVAQAFIPPIGGRLMNLDGKGGTPEIAIFTGLATSLLVMFVTMFCWPETLGESKSGKTSRDEQNTSDEDATLLSTNTSSKRPSLARVIGIKLHTISSDIALAVSGVGFLNILLLALSITSATIGIKATDWFGLVQYPVIKLSWTYPQASAVVSIQAVVMLANFGLLLPTYTRLGTRHLGSATRASFAIMIASAAVLTGGAMLVGLSATSAAFLVGMVVYTLGEGLTVATQAYIASVVDRTYLARVMATLAVAAAGGKAIASAGFPVVLAKGLDTNVRGLIGLPFFVAAGLFVVAGACVVVVGIRSSASRGGDAAAAAGEVHVEDEQP